jgi:pimeloyl-ACP methyl ester carboxylesterase
MKVEKIQTSYGSVSYRVLGTGSRKVLFFHGFPGSSAQIAIFQSFLKSQDLQVICFDRPGYHHTPIKTNDMLNMTVGIAKELTKQKNWQSFEVVTVSGGTPYGISLALKDANVTQVRVICGLGCIVHPRIQKQFSLQSTLGLSLLPHIPGKIITAVIMASAQKGPATKRAQVMEYFFPTSPADNKCLRPEKIEILNQNLSEALIQNALGPKQDARVFMSNWAKNFSLLKIPIYFWHGDEDYIVPYKVSEEMTKLFSNSKYFLMKNEGHLSLPIMRTEEIMAYNIT